MGVGIWLLSLPLLTAHPAGTLPASARTAWAAPAASWAPPRPFRQVRPALALGQLVTTPAAPADSPTLTIGANWILIPRLGVSLPVGWYSDCLGRALVPRWGAWRWNCAGSNNTYIMAHNPGTFTPILDLRAGDLIEYGDPQGTVHLYRVTFTAIVTYAELWPLHGLGRPSLTLQTCWTWDGTRDFIVRAIES